MVQSYNNFLLENNKYTFTDLKTILLDENGGSVLEVYEEDLINLIESSDFYDPHDYDYKLLHMNHSQCHSNVCSFYKNFIDDVNNSEEEIAIMTGWALSNDNRWYQHTWICLHFDDIIIETTEPRKLYYGFELKFAQLDKFLEENL